MHSRILSLLGSLALIPLLAAAHGKQANALFRQGNQFFEKNRFADAVAAFTAVLENDPGDLRARYNRALANEMLDRQQAIGDWKRFAELAALDPNWTTEVKRIRERIRTLEGMPALPAGLQPSAYVAKAGDYYGDVARESQGHCWTEFPVKIYLTSPPKEWGDAARRALDQWKSVFPIQEVDAGKDADILINWENLTKTREGFARSGTEFESTDIVRRDATVVRRVRKCFITLDTSRRWRDQEMLSTVLHEIGHALGMKGHSLRSRDLMFPENREIVEGSRGGEGPAWPPTQGPTGAILKSRVNPKLGPRDINTLIRLYNSAGPLETLK